MMIKIFTCLLLAASLQQIAAQEGSGMPPGLFANISVFFTFHLKIKSCLLQGIGVKGGGGAENRKS